MASSSQKVLVVTHISLKIVVGIYIKNINMFYHFVYLPPLFSFSSFSPSFKLILDFFSRPPHLLVMMIIILTSFKCYY